MGQDDYAKTHNINEDTLNELISQEKEKMASAIPELSWGWNKKQSR